MRTSCRRPVQPGAARSNIRDRDRQVTPDGNLSEERFHQGRVRYRYIGIRAQIILYLGKSEARYGLPMAATTVLSPARSRICCSSAPGASTSPTVFCMTPLTFTFFPECGTI